MVILLACVVFASDQPRKGANSALEKPEASNSADELARKVVTNELKAEDQDQTRWMYRMEHDEPGKSENKKKKMSVSSGCARIPANCRNSAEQDNRTVSKPGIC